MSATLFGKRIFADVIKVQRSSGFSGWDLNLMTCPSIRQMRRHRYREKRRKPFEDGGRDWSGAATSQGTFEANRSWKRQGRILP